MLMFIAGLAGLEKMKKDKPEQVSRAAAFCGLSVGEYTAHCAAGSFSFEDGLRFLVHRSKAMAESIERTPQAMVSVVGLEKSKLEPICKEAAKMEGEDGVCEIALQLFPNGITVGGTAKACALLEEKAVKAGAQMAKNLGDTGFHTSCMQYAADQIEKEWQDFAAKITAPKHTVWSIATAEPVRPGCDPVEVKDTLKKMMTKCVLWESMCKEIIKELKDPNAEYYEVGPGKQLKTMMKRIDQNAWKNMENYEV
jgi:[acyl-carrier-protein] S-malonyltransferase